MKKLLFVLISVCLCFAMCKKNEGCPSGYEGEDCDIEIRVKFYGFYAGTLSGGGQREASQTELTVFQGDVEKILWDKDAYLVVTGSTNFDIPKQQVQSSGNIITLEGGGSLSGDELIMNFTGTMSGTSVDFTFVGNKQKSKPAKALPQLLDLYLKSD